MSNKANWQFPITVMLLCNCITNIFYSFSSLPLLFPCCVFLLLLTYYCTLNYGFYLGIISSLLSLPCLFSSAYKQQTLVNFSLALFFPRGIPTGRDRMSSGQIACVQNGEEVKCYPAPLATHEVVVNHPSLFWDTLKKFHLAMGTKFMVPVIGGKELDLHVLYVEVTHRGGYDKVVVEKKWREIGNVFNFSPTTTSASYVLKRHYHSILHHYEHVYFLKLQGPLISSTDAYPASKLSSGPEIAGLLEYPAEGGGEPPNPLVEATGTINGKFDCGYLVTVKLGSEILHGVLYYPDQPDPGRPTTQTAPCNAIVPYTGQPNGARRRRRKKRRGGDPSRPKPNRSGYNFFFAEKHLKLKSLYPAREREFTKMIGESWNKLSPEEKMVYKNIGLKDKERYKREMEEYKKTLTPTHVRNSGNC